MNEMDLKTKIEGLEKAITEHKDFMQNYESTLKATQQELEDYNKPELSPIVMDQIHDAVESVLNNFDWSETDNYDDLEYDLDYEGRVSLSNISFDPSDIHERIVDKVCNLFKEAPAPEDETTNE